ncbi:beta-glucoside bgl operon antiterminator, BglG family [Geomicrobium sp. JCM 19039]|nr:beta-glucoside bgl operon antiterminator, BglG family [Geomicrobium sp. JCM 19039]
MAKQRSEEVMQTMKIIKVLNNNAVIILDEDEQEQIAIGNGVGFNKRKHDPISEEKIEKRFVLKGHEKLQELLVQIPQEHFHISKEIIAHAEKQLKTTLHDQILLALTDHISFAIEREAQGIHLKNKLLNEIKILYKAEYEIGLWAIGFIKDEINVQMPIDEAAFIALHIHTMKFKAGNVQETVRQTSMLRDMVEIIKSNLHLSFAEDAISYERLITHLRFALARTYDQTAHAMDKEMQQMIKRKFKVSHQCAEEVAKTLASKYDITLPGDELCYIALHIERLRNTE